MSSLALRSSARRPLVLALALVGVGSLAPCALAAQVREHDLAPVVKRDEILDPASPDGDVVQPLGATREALEVELVRLTALRAELHTDATEFCLEISSQLVFHAALATTLGLVVEGIAQSLRSTPWENTTPVFLIGGAAAGAGLGAIGGPFLAACASDHGYRRAERIARRRHAIAQRLDAMAEPEAIPEPPASYVRLVPRLGGLALTF